MRLGIIGLGPRGLGVLERVLARARAASDRLFLDIFEPAELGVGVHNRAQPDYLLLNTVCSQLTAFSDAEMVGAERATTPGPDLHHWLNARPESAGDVPTRVAFDEFLPRRLLGEYLHWAADHLLGSDHPNVVVRVHREAVVGLEHSGSAVCLETGRGRRFTVDAAIVTTGHGLPNGAARRRRLDFLENPFDHVRPESSVVIVGTGLTAMDAMVSLTVGRGGRFVAGADGRLAYQPSGGEPHIVFVNRTGWLPCARPSLVAGRKPEAPRFMTTESLLRKSVAGRPLVSTRADVEPAIRAEMFGLAGESARSPVADVLDPPERWSDHRAFTASVVGRATADLVEARRGLERSPYKRALEALRDHREFLRVAADLPHVDTASRRDLFESVGALVNRCVIGPQKERIAELLSLVDCGLVSFGPGPAPTIAKDGAQWVLSSSRLDTPTQVRADQLVEAILRWPLHDVAAEPVTAMLRDADPGKAWFDRLPLTREGFLDTGDTVFPTVAVLGPPAEGSSYYNHYVPSPGTASRALRDVDLVLDRLVPTA